MELANMKERYASYKNQMERTWIYRFTWNGVFNNAPQNKVCITNFERETQSFNNMEIVSDAKSFHKAIEALSVQYIDWCQTKTIYDATELMELKNFFVGCIGEYFFTSLLEHVKCMLIADKHNDRKLERFDFDYVCPRLLDEKDYGVDLTGVVNHNNNVSNCVFQVKFWNPSDNGVITNTIASGIYSDAALNHFIDDGDNNIFVCWLGSPEKVTLYLKENLPLYKHISFVDYRTLDNCINGKIPEFWSLLHDDLARIGDFEYGD